ncbi:caspase domain-containing protein [Kribbella sp. VKM Ac-2527]|uniref:Caspase domain-containing protein n=1 Tax=Kribbella caucasensis TaxID=2512215 RepID=A0A4V6PT02_9ACTN|nr:caspase family protein [Kribbella sp. VKM Ac-2527]TDO43328.1 caspase domain-containing protein [Kribbella sp. VKM Ac-2527]
MAGNGGAAQRLALIVATSAYEDDGLAQLVSPAHDAAALAGVLADPAIGGFAVTSVLDAPSGQISQTIEDFAAERDRGDLLLLYLSCHGLKDEQGRLYFAARDTRRDRLRSTAVPAGFVNDVLFDCRSRCKVLLLDCCYSGAFARGLSVKADPSVHTSDHFDARGLVVLTASDATQYAFEGDNLVGRATPSIFTSSVTRGLQTGAADIDGDGLVSVDDMYEYARRQLAEQPGLQTPRKWEFDVAGTIVLARSPAATEPTNPKARPEVRPAGLPVVLAADPVAAAAGSTRVRERQWWLGALLFLVTAVVLNALLTWWIFDFVYFLGVTDTRPSKNTGRVAGGLGGAVWAAAYAVVDAGRSSPAHWHDLHLRWLATLRHVFQPSGLREFLRAVCAAVPLNVGLTVLLSIGVGVLGYHSLGGSQGRDNLFPLTYIVLTGLAVGIYLVGEQRGRNPGREPRDGRSLRG